jgi:hypothetical protein
MIFRRAADAAAEAAGAAVVECVAGVVVVCAAAAEARFAVAVGRGPRHTEHRPCRGHLRARLRVGQARDRLVARGHPPARAPAAQLDLPWEICQRPAHVRAAHGRVAVADLPTSPIVRAAARGPAPVRDPAAILPAADHDPARVREAVGLRPATSEIFLI